MGIFTKEEADSMGAFEETALDTVDARAAEVALPEHGGATAVPTAPGGPGDGQ
ncbi:MULTISPECIES: hypothetical protein [Achromobacter]|uniref:hypothetical protein n=1 Tax=Achromobacter TaxID=222 RepID=UPI000ABC7E31|nr:MULTISPECIES: hypothetical protein [Achromobacter]